MNEIEIVKNHVKMSVGSIFSKLTAVVASPAVQNHHKMVIDRKTIEKTWKYMDKVSQQNLPSNDNIFCKVNQSNLTIFKIILLLMIFFPRQIVFFKVNHSNLTNFLYFFQLIFWGQKLTKSYVKWQHFFVNQCKLTLKLTYFNFFFGQN